MWRAERVTICEFEQKWDIVSQTLACTTLLVHDYDTAIDFFTRALWFSLLQDTALPDGKR